MEYSLEHVVTQEAES